MAGMSPKPELSPMPVLSLTERRASSIELPPMPVTSPKPRFSSTVGMSPRPEVSPMPVRSPMGGRASMLKVSPIPELSATTGISTGATNPQSWEPPPPKSKPMPVFPRSKPPESKLPRSNSSANTAGINDSNMVSTQIRAIPLFMLLFIFLFLLCSAVFGKRPAKTASLYFTIKNITNTSYLTGYFAFIYFFLFFLM